MSTTLKVREFTSIEEKFPLVHIDKQGRTLTKLGKYAVIVEIAGKDYSGLDYETIESFFQGRKQFFDALPTNISVLHHSHRFRLSRNLNSYNFTNDCSEEIAKRWGTSFTETFRTHHYLIFLTDAESLKDQIVLKEQSKYGGSVSDEHLRILEETIDNCITRFSSYGAKRLKGNMTASYWASRLNGMEVRQKLPENGFIDDLLAQTTLRFPEGQRYQVYDGVAERYSTWLVIMAPPVSTSSGLFEGLFQLQHEFSLYQTFGRIDKQEALAFVVDKQRNNASFMTNEEINAELSELYSRLQTDELNLVSHRFSVEVFGDTIDDMELAAREIQNSIETWGYRVSREALNTEALFWSKFPETHKFNPRQRNLTSFNASHFATFASIGEGTDTCSWGNSPVTLFKTSTGSDYSFIFHESAAKEALGNTIILGGSGKGKTTTLSFLFSQCFKYENFKILCFDRLRGLEVFTKFHEGEYLDFQEGIQINPLQLDDSQGNRAFLNKWFQMLTQRHDEKSLIDIGNAIQQLFTLEKKERTLVDIAPAFGLSEPDSIAAVLKRWMPDESFGKFFNGKKDALDFSSQLVTFDMTNILDVPEILGPMAYYIFHKLFLGARGDGGYLVFVDELARYLKSEEFVPRIEEILQEIRKTDGIFIGAVQSADKILNHKAKDTFLNNIATWICFSEPLAQEEHYIGELGFNEKEFEWIKQDHARKVLIKRKSGESVILDVDLKPLGNYLNVFNSGKEAIKKLNTLQREDSDDWKSKYLAQV